MKTKIIIFAIIAALTCTLICACSKPAETPADTQDTPDTEIHTGEEETKPAETKTVGEWSVDVPEGYEFSIGDFFDENDTRYFQVKKSTFSYFDFSADGEDLIMTHYNYNKETYTNEQTEFTVTYGGNEWTGFLYSDGFGGYGFEAYATIGGQLIRVSSAGFTVDVAAAQQVLGSVRYTGSN